MDNAADRKSIRRKEKSSHLADIQRREVITSVMSTSFGRQWIWDQLAEAHIFTTTFNGDALQSAFQEGQRSRGLALLADILLACPDQYITAMRESNERHHSHDASTGTGSAAGRTGDLDRSSVDPADEGFPFDSDRDDDLYGEGYSRTDH